jgi:hypothetical protein
MLLEGDEETLRAYLGGERRTDRVRRYFERRGIHQHNQSGSSPHPCHQWHAIAADGKRSLVRFPLTSLNGLIAEAARVYRQMRDNKLDHVKGRSLVWVLSQMRWPRIASAPARGVASLMVRMGPPRNITSAGPSCGCACTGLGSTPDAMNAEAAPAYSENPDARCEYSTA